MLSAKELFKHGNKPDQSLPTRGGVKDFMPDGSWLQDKHIENFNQERERIISEPRVSRRQDLAKGEWKPDRGLVELTYEVRNFWEQMGFNDEKRKWLYGEEALFLLESGVFELWYQGLPMSIQEAYAAVLGNRLSLEYYQVYSHLRRLGYVVFRHQGRYEFTKYERKIGLDKHAEAKKKKQRDKVAKTESKQGEQASEIVQGKPTKNAAKNKIGNRVNEDVNSLLSDKVTDIDKSESTEDDVVKDGRNINNELRTLADKEFTSVDGDKQDDTAEDLAVNNSDRRKTSKMEWEDVETCLEGNSITKTCERNAVTRNYGLWSEKVKSYDKSKDYTAKVSNWNFDEIYFPNFKAAIGTVYVDKPKLKYIPQGKDVCFCEERYSFEKRNYINTKKQSKKQQILDEELVRKLDFSYPEIMRGKLKVKKSCRNWKEYKSALEKEKTTWERGAALPHLYRKKVKPLVKPELAQSTYAVLEQLKVIQEDAPARLSCKPEMLPDFDVYAPNIKFRKTQPGLPDFRVKVVKMSDPVPGLDVINAITSYLRDEAALHWAVVNSGNIAFHNIADFTLPQDITLG